VKIKSGSSDDQRNDAALIQRENYLARKSSVLVRVKRFGQRQVADKMMFYDSELGGGGFSGQNIQTVVNLECVGANDFGVKPARNFECKVGLANTRCTGKHHIFQIRHKTKTRALQESAGKRELQRLQIRRLAPYLEFLHR
jgi:hypothetical protein